MKSRKKILYAVLAVLILAIATIGTTYAYWTASTESASSAVQTGSTIYSISMNITPLYHDFSVIPMDDEDAVKALAKKCRDKYDRGACSAYTIYVYDYNEDLDFISGFMDITTNNMQNLSYMMLRLSDTFEEGKCVTIPAEDTKGEDEIYCVAKEATHMGDGVKLSLGDVYDVSGMESTKFILLMWLTNLKQSQNDIDVGSFNAIVTMQAGNGGEIKGSIASAIKVNPGTSSGADTGDGTGTGTDTGTDTGSDTDTDIGTDSGTQEGTSTDTDTDIGTDSGTQEGTSTDTDTGTESGTEGE